MNGALTAREARAATTYEVCVGGRVLARFGRDWAEAVASAEAVARATPDRVTIARVERPDVPLWDSKARRA